MPVVLALFLILAVVLASILLVPVTLFQRYRTGRARRRARPWLAGINATGIGLSMVLFLVTAALTNVWVPQALAYSGAGLAAGMIVGLLGLALTTWESRGADRFYTPNRWLVLAITLVVAARIAVGLWRSWHAWQSVAGYGEWLAASGVAGSLAAGAAILGYYWIYWIGIFRKSRRPSLR